jgi:hypothetical protein
MVGYACANLPYVFTLFTPAPHFVAAGQSFVAIVPARAVAHTSAKNPLTTLTRPSIERVLSVSDDDVQFN